MKVFISWSGERSLEAARALKDWLPQVINEVEPWMSDEDIAVGGDWSAEIRRNLNEAAFGIICLTPSNMLRPWVLFEAGALSRQLGNNEALVAPFLIGFESKSMIVSPISRFQAVLPEFEDVHRLVASINTRCANPRTEKQIDQAIRHWWPSLDQRLEDLVAIPEVQQRHRSDRKVLEDILALTRQNSMRQDSRGRWDHPISRPPSDKTDLEKIRYLLYTKPNRYGNVGNSNLDETIAAAVADALGFKIQNFIQHDGDEAAVVVYATNISGPARLAFRTQTLQRYLASLRVELIIV